MPVTTAMREANKKAHCNALDKVNVQSVWVTASQTVTAKNVVATDSISAGCLTTTSDARYKKNIKDAQLGLDFINKLRPVTYQLKNGNKFNDGLIAQELENVLNENNLSKENHSMVNYDKKLDKYGINYNQLLGPLINSIKELTKQNKILLEKVNILENKIN